MHVNIRNARKSLSCQATTFEVRPSSDSPAVTVASVPLQSSWPIGAGEVSQHKIAISVSDGSSTADARVTITIKDLSSNLVNTRIVPVKIVRPQCVRADPQLSATCASQITIDKKNPAPVGSSSGPDAWKSGLDQLRCSLYFRNLDEWTCTDRTFQISWNKSAMAPRSLEFFRNVTFDIESYRHFPGNYTFSTFYLWFNRSVPFINETLSYTSYLEVVMANDVSPPQTAGISVLAGACDQFAPNITLASPAYQNITIFSGGVGTYWFTVSSYNNQFCGDVRCSESRSLGL